MSIIDWTILIVTLSGIILYGIYKSRTTRNLEGYFLSNRSLPWYLVLLSIMGTQASAITYLTGPGQSFTDGMRFVQYYFGLPLAMIVISIFFVPAFSKLNVLTAYEFLEHRFDRIVPGAVDPQQALGNQAVEFTRPALELLEQLPPHRWSPELVDVFGDALHRFFLFVGMEKGGDLIGHADEVAVVHRGKNSGSRQIIR